jgi:hypothetical protein
MQMHSVAGLVAAASLALLATPGSAQTDSTAEASVSLNLRQPRMHRLARQTGPLKDATFFNSTIPASRFFPTIPAYTGSLKVDRPDAG